MPVPPTLVALRQPLHGLRFGKQVQARTLDQVHGRVAQAALSALDADYFKSTEPNRAKEAAFNGLLPQPERTRPWSKIQGVSLAGEKGPAHQTLILTETGEDGTEKPVGVMLVTDMAGTHAKKQDDKTFTGVDRVIVSARALPGQEKALQKALKQHIDELVAGGQHRDLIVLADQKDATLHQLADELGQREGVHKHHVGGPTGQPTPETMARLHKTFGKDRSLYWFHISALKGEKLSGQ